MLLRKRYLCLHIALPNFLRSQGSTQYAMVPHQDRSFPVSHFWRCWCPKASQRGEYRNWTNQQRCCTTCSASSQEPCTQVCHRKSLSFWSVSDQDCQESPYFVSSSALSCLDRSLWCAGSPLSRSGYSLASSHDRRHLARACAREPERSAQRKTWLFPDRILLSFKCASGRKVRLRWPTPWPCRRWASPGRRTLASWWMDDRTSSRCLARLKCK